METQLSQSIDRKLGVIIALLMRMKDAEAVSPALREQVWTLYELGLKPTEIAQILGRSSSYVNKELTGLRRDRA
jgi:DNA-directed RNA polymerase specialized sigma24 family protein